MSDPINSTVIELAQPGTVGFAHEAIDQDRLGASEILAQSAFTAISPGTELAAYAGEPSLRAGVTYPRLVGYCNVAHVLQVGSEVQFCAPGDAVVSLQSHRTHFRCHEDDVLAVLAPEDDLSEMCKIYLFHIGYTALLRSDVRAGHRVGIIGYGAIGRGASALAALAGAEVTVFTSQCECLQEMDRSGIHFLPKTPAGSAAVNALPDPTLDVMITTSNSWTDWTLALTAVRRYGKIAVLGFPGCSEPPGNYNPLMSRLFHDRQIEIIACGYSPRITGVEAHDLRFTTRRNCEYLAQLSRSRRLDTSAIPSKVIPWKSLQNGYERLHRRSGSECTLVLDWS